MYKLRNALTLLGFLLVLGGCATMHAPPNPVATADRPETVGLALYGGYTLAEESAGEIAANVNTPQNVKDALKAADVKASLVVEQIPPLAQEVGKMRADIAAGGGSPNLLQTSIVKLNDWINQAAPLIKSFIDAVTGAKAK